MKNTTAIGQRAEALACDYLKANGFEIVERNYRDRFCEIDIIAKNNDSICFVEVKFRNTNDFGGGVGAIHHYKQQRLQKAAGSWLAHHPELDNLQPQIDIIAIDQHNQIEHLPNAIY